jgi:ribosomal protein S18 acetylase RimI-like enzyme
MPDNVSHKDTPTIRNLRPKDLEAVVVLDAKITGRRRDGYFRVKLDQALKETGVMVSLAAEVDGAFAGFLLSRVFYGEFGAMEAAAVLDTLGVHPAFRGKGVGRALLSQLRTNLLGLGIAQLRTEVSWESQELMAFFRREGFRPAPRICLDLDLEAHRDRAAETEAEADARA